MAAVLCVRIEAALSHWDAAALWGIRTIRSGPIEIVVRGRSARSQPGLKVHRSEAIWPHHVMRRHGIPVTSPACTLVDIATRPTHGRSKPWSTKRTSSA